jgi:drug/metabolite transporter (DMT)-like permease
MIVGLLAALFSAFAYGIASVLQASAARRAPGTAGVDARLLARLVKQGPFIAGVCLDGLGFVAQFVALRTLAVFVVQAIQASNLAVTAVVSIPLLGARLRGREWAAVAAVCAGLGVLAFSAGSDQHVNVGTAKEWGLLGGAIAITVLGYVVGALGGKYGPATLGFVAGLGFGVVALAARVITNLSIGDLVRNPALWALALAGVVSFLFYATALQRGSVTTVTAAVIIGETLLPSLIGVLLLGDRTRPGFAPLAVLGFAVAVAGAIMLARFGEPEPRAADVSGHAESDRSQVR